MSHRADEWAEFQTPAARAEYARRLRAFAQRMALEGDQPSADINTWMAENYERPVEENV